jgi:hypothetical protein
MSLGLFQDVRYIKQGFSNLLDFKIIFCKTLHGIRPPWNTVGIISTKEVECPLAWTFVDRSPSGSWTHGF